MGALLVLCIALLLVTPGHAIGQSVAGGTDAGRVLIFEHDFAGGTADSVMVNLVRHVVYRAHTSGPGEPTFRPLRKYKWSALVVPAGKDPVRHTAEFEVHASETGPHVMRIAGLPPGGRVTLWLYEDTVETRRIADADDRDFSTGLSFGGGFHSGYRLDPTGGANPVGGGDVEGCILADTGTWFSVCLGVGRQSLPNAGLTVMWFFLEPRARFLSGQLLRGHRTDVGASIRFAQAPETGRRNISPSLLAAGLYLTQHLAGQNHSRGWSVYSAWQHGRLGNVPETERRSTDRFTAGLSWVP